MNASDKSQGTLPGWVIISVSLGSVVIAAWIVLRQAWTWASPPGMPPPAIFHTMTQAVIGMSLLAIINGLLASHFSPPFIRAIAVMVEFACGLYAGSVLFFWFLPYYPKPAAYPEVAILPSLPLAGVGAWLLFHSMYNHKRSYRVSGSILLYVIAPLVYLVLEIQNLVQWYTVDFPHLLGWTEINT